jgi:uncharacterized protein
MKSTETEILVIAGYEGSGDVHWQRRLISKLSSAKLVEQDDWLYGSLPTAVAAIVNAVALAQKPVVFVAHSAGCALVAHATKALIAQGTIAKVKGAFLVSVPDPTILKTLAGIDPNFANVPRDLLPFPSVLISSSNDPFCSVKVSKEFAAAWGSEWADAGEAGHINTASGHGPWPEGMMKFAGFLSKLSG